MTIKDALKKSKVTMRELSELTGVSTALICYISAGYATFPSYEQLNLACARMGCEPKDIYPNKELRRMYPSDVETVKKNRTNENPRVRIDKEAYEILQQTYGDVGKIVNQLIQKQIRHDLMEEEGHYL